MKRILLLFALVLVNVAFSNAQSSLQIVDKHGGVVDPGTVIKVRSTDLSLYSLGTEEYLIKNIGSQSVSVRVKKEIVVEIEGTTNDMCLGTCFGPEVFVSPTPGISVAPGATSLEYEAFSAHYHPQNQEGITLLKYTFFDNNDESNAVSFLVDFYAGPNVGIVEYDHHATLSAYPNPVLDVVTIEYSVKAQQNTRLVMYNINGQKVHEQALDAVQSSVKVSMGHLPKGVYIYRVEGENYQTTYQKVVRK